MFCFLLRISLFKETINEDTKMIGLYVFGFSEVQWAWDLSFFGFVCLFVSGKDLARQLFQAYGWSTGLGSYLLIISAPTPNPYRSSVRAPIQLRS